MNLLQLWITCSTLAAILATTELSSEPHLTHSLSSYDAPTRVLHQQQHVATTHALTPDISPIGHPISSSYIKDVTPYYYAEEVGWGGVRAPHPHPLHHSPQPIPIHHSSPHQPHNTVVYTEEAVAQVVPVPVPVVPVPVPVHPGPPLPREYGLVVGARHVREMAQTLTDSARALAITSDEMTERARSLTKRMSDLMRQLAEVTKTMSDMSNGLAAGVREMSDLIRDSTERTKTRSKDMSSIAVNMAEVVRNLANDQTKIQCPSPRVKTSAKTKAKPKAKS